MDLPTFIPLIVLLLLIAGVLYLISAGSNIRFRIKNGTGFVSGPLYSASFPLDSILSVEILPSIPEGIRTNGLSAGVMAGHFVLEGIGPCQVYAYARNQPALLIRCGGGTILLGGRTPEETESWRRALTNHS